MHCICSLKGQSGELMRFMQAQQEPGGNKEAQQNQQGVGTALGIQTKSSRDGFCRQFASWRLAVFRNIYICMFHSFKSQTYKNFVRPNERLRSFLSGQELSQERTEPDSHSLKFAGTISGKKKKRCIFCNKWTKLFPILSSPHCSFQQAMCYSSPGLNPSCTRQTGDTNVH